MFFTSLLFMFFYSLDACCCEYKVEYKEEGQGFPDDCSQERFTLSELDSSNHKESANTQENPSGNETVSSRQKKVLVATFVFVACTLALLIIIDGQSQDLEKRVKNSEEQIAYLLKLINQQSSSVPGTESSTPATGTTGEERKKPADWQFGFGF